MLSLSGSMLMLLAKATLILLAALAITVTMQRASAGARHLVWLVTLSTLLLVPALAAWSPLRLEILPATKAAPALPAVTGSAPISTSAAKEGTSAPTAATYTTPDSESPANFLGRMSALSLALGIWAGVSLLLLAWLAYSALTVRRIVRNARPLDTEDWLVPLWEIADRLELDDPPKLLASSEAKMPFACGFISPTIVLPADCEKWSTDRRSAVLLHEFAHVKRRDLAGHTLGRIACAFYWFHPLVWTAAKQLRNESERACDDLALSCGAKASDYAEHLLDIVTSVKGDATPAVAMAMARRKEFEGRMLAILDPDLRHSRPSRRQSAALIASLAAIAVVVGAAAPAPRAAKVVVSSSVPVTMGSRDEIRNFTPADVAKPDKGSSESKSWERKYERTQTSTSTKTDKVNSTTMSAATAAPADFEANAEAEIDGIAARAIAQLRTEGVEPRAVKPDDRPVLLANILRTEKDPALRKIAAWGLSEYAETNTAMEALAYALRNDSDASVREMAGWALADCREASTPVKALTDALRSDSNADVRAIAAWSLGNIGARAAVGPLTAALSDSNKEVRARAAWAIGNIEPREAPPQLIALLKDSQPIMRQLAAWALYQIQDPSAAGALNAALKAESNPELRIDYIRALAATGEKSVDALRELLTSPDPKIKSMAIRALAGGQGAGPWPWPWPEPRPGY